MLLYITQFILFTLSKKSVLSFNLNVKKDNIADFNLAMDKELVFTLYRER